MSDPIYTPQHLAQEMAQAVTRSRVGTVVDIAVGGGELLRAAEARWPSSTLYGLDIDSSAIRRLKRRHRNWILRTGDLLSPSSFRPLWPKTDALLLNPPFSCRGGTRVAVDLAGETCFVSLALACLIRGLSLLKQHGEGVALMPAGSLHSEKDRTAWLQLKEIWNVTVVRECDRNTFHSFYPSTVLLHFCRRAGTLTQSTPAAEQKTLGFVRIVRGKVQMHAACADGTPSVSVLHTTDLPALINSPKARSRGGNGTVQGSCVLLPRVGKPDSRKLLLHHFDHPVRLSDCLFALTCSSPSETSALFQHMQSEWHRLESRYIGTGARFLTQNRLTDFLNELEYEANTVQNICS